MSPVQILIVDDHPLFRRGIGSTLEAEPDLVVVGEAADAAEAIDRADLLSPDIVLIDVDLSETNGLDLTRVLKRRHPQMAVMLLAAQENDERLFQAIRVGAAAYVTKDISPDELITLIRRAAAGEYPINDNVLSRPSVASHVLAQFRTLSQSEQAAENVFSPLTPREIEILDIIAQGNSNKAIARQLGISDQTVKNHITSILRKLAVNDRTEAVIFALRRGWISLGEEVRTR